MIKNLVAVVSAIFLISSCKIFTTRESSETASQIPNGTLDNKSKSFLTLFGSTAITVCIKNPEAAAIDLPLIQVKLASDFKRAGIDLMGFAKCR
ncbi:MAG: hypothetical protein HQK54_11055, partial [Oligoflexales bacterium]|nr:hypothetical protein [Oligoflexales bacterium]